MGDSVLEVGAGIGNISGRLMSKRLLYVAGEKDNLHLHALHNRFLRTPNVTVQRIDPEIPEHLKSLETCFDTALCLNVLEYIEDAESVVARLAATLKPGGNLIVLVPRGPDCSAVSIAAWGTSAAINPTLCGSCCKPTASPSKRCTSSIAAGAPPWWAYGKLLGSRKINKPVLKLFDKTVWLWRRLEWLMPWPGLSLIAVARKPGGEQAPEPSAFGPETVSVASSRHAR